MSSLHITSTCQTPTFIMFGYPVWFYEQCCIRTTGASPTFVCFCRVWEAVLKLAVQIFYTVLVVKCMSGLKFERHTLNHGALHETL